MVIFGLMSELSIIIEFSVVSFLVPLHAVYIHIFLFSVTYLNYLDFFMANNNVDFCSLVGQLKIHHEIILLYCTYLIVSVLAFLPGFAQVFLNRS